jgi:hypothetical protein
MPTNPFSTPPISGPAGRQALADLWDMAAASAATLRTVSAITAVNATAFLDGSIVIAKGRDAEGDGGGGVFRYVAASAQAADGGSVFAPTAGGGRLFRDGWTVFGFNGAMHGVWFGLKGDGTDETAAFNRATAAARGLELAPGTYIVDNTTITGSISLNGVDGAEATIIKRKSTAATGNWIYVTAPSFECKGITWDGNKAANVHGCNVLTLDSGVVTARVEFSKFINAQTSGGGWGDGLVDLAYTTAGSREIVGNVFDSNAANGIDSENVFGMLLSGNTATNNGYSGISLNNLDVTLAQKIQQSSVIGNRASSNGRCGIEVGNFFADNNYAVPLYDRTNRDALYVNVSGNVCQANGNYGIVADGFNMTVTSNVCYGNATVLNSCGGILFNASDSVLADNVCEANIGFGIDAGGSANSDIVDNVILNNGTTSFYPGLNIEGCLNVLVQGNTVEGNGGASGVQIMVERVGGSSATTAFNDLFTSSAAVRGNHIRLDNDTQIGIKVANNCDKIDLVDNDFDIPGTLAALSNCIRFYGQYGTIEGNRVLTANMEQLTPNAGTGVLVVPDVLDRAYTAAATTVTDIRHKSQDDVGTGVAWVTMTNEGAGYTAQPAVSFTGGGGGAGAAGYALISADGKVRGVRMTSFGAGYTSAPAVVFTGGGGAGAAATAQWKQPLVNGRRLELHTNTACTLNRAGLFNVMESPEAANIAMPVSGIIELRAQFAQWYVARRNFVPTIYGTIPSTSVTGLGTVATLDVDIDGTMAANSDTRVASQKAVRTYVANKLLGMLDLLGTTDCSANPNYPAASKGAAYYISVTGKIGGGGGKSVDAGDFYVALADNAGGTEASVGASWFVLEHNLIGALLGSNNLSDIASATTALSNLGLSANGKSLVTAANYAAMKGLLAIANTDVSGLGTMSTQNANAVAITGGTLAGLTGFAIRNAGTGAFDMTMAYSGTLTAGRALTWNLNDAARSVSLSGNISTSGDLTMSGAFALTLTVTGATNVTFPTTGTLATRAGAETLTTKTMDGGSNTFTNISLTSSVTGTLPTTNGGTGDTGGACTTYTPTVTTGSGTITTLGSASGRYKRFGRLMFLEITVPITTNGTGGTSVRATLPLSLTSASDFYLVGREILVSGKELEGRAGVSSTYVEIFNYDNTYPGGSATQITVSGWIETTT